MRFARHRVGRIPGKLGGVKIVCAPDSFKGSATAGAVALALSEGLSRALTDAEIIAHPLTDGGEGTLDVLSDYGFDIVDCSIATSNGDTVAARFARKGSVAVVESAEGCRFDPHASPDDALSASSAGVGHLIMHAVSEGATQILLTVGGTSSTDGGIGMLQALGFEGRDQKGNPIPPGGAGLVDLAALSASAVDEGLLSVEFSVLTDVDNPLLGPEGAAAIFSPQKGATPEGVQVLERGLAQLAALTAGSWDTVPGAGAGGGLGFAAMAYLGATRQSGALAMMEVTGFDAALEGCDVVITGEGSFDDQSLRGKIPAEVIARASARGIPVYVVCGVDRLVAREAIGDTSVREVISLSSMEPDPRASMENARDLLEKAGFELGSRLQSS